MNTSIILAQILGITFVILGLSMIFNKKRLEEFTNNQDVVWLGGLVSVMVGASVVVLNNVWTSGLPLFVTIMGWLALLKGATIILFPNFTTSYYRKINKGNIFIWGGILSLVLGLVLLFYR